MGRRWRVDRGDLKATPDPAEGVRTIFTFCRYCLGSFGVEIARCRPDRRRNAF